MTLAILMPDVTPILDDPELGGGQAFQVKRVTVQRIFNETTQKLEEAHQPKILNATGNIQPQSKSVQPSTAEDLLNEGIVVYTTFIFQTGSNEGQSFLGPDEILYNGDRWRITQVQNWKDWGFNIAYATKVRG